MTSSEPLAIREELLEARAFAESADADDRLELARGTVCAALTAYWSDLHPGSAAADWPLRELPADAEAAPLPEAGKELASAIGARAAGMDVMDAGYATGWRRSGRTGG